ncbi:hypothetical protein Fot_23703 [Forsythia ovata]|uniref:Uncharacterized protein n=1 Tax=Forsythia ovata TaxID=205694 RepID=A0ABD1U452_9LAMI
MRHHIPVYNMTTILHELVKDRENVNLILDRPQVLMFEYFGILADAYSNKAAEVPFDQNYDAAWGGNLVTVLEQGTQLTSAIPNRPAKKHDEFDLELLGCNMSMKYTEEMHSTRRVKISTDDGSLIRMFKNNIRIGANYFSKPMHIETSQWNATWEGNVDWKNEFERERDLVVGIWATEKRRKVKQNKGVISLLLGTET